MPVELRSDTATQPTPDMRRAMAEAAVGDDVLGDDPTVQALERCTAELLGKPAAVYMPSGTMTNQVAIRAHTEAGDAIFLEANAHSYYYESGGPAALSGVTCRLIPTERGVFGADDLKAAIRPRNIHFPRASLVCVENTHNRGGGTIWPIETIDAVADVAEAEGLTLHMDGARLWNASAATGRTPAEYAARFDSVSVCFSKGLGAPVGSALVGDEAFIDRARRFRKMFGGGMRQAGIIAAGALYALEHHRDRLCDDHANARALADGLAGIDGIEIDPARVETNLVYFDVPGMPATDLAARLAERDVLVLALGPHRLRAVTSLMVTRADIDTAVAAAHEATA